MEIPIWDAQAIKAEASQIGAEVSRRKLIKLSIPETERKCELIEGEEAEEAAGELVKKMRGAGAL
jgi:electron transfer flavoprotein alpha/beta subunit